MDRYLLHSISTAMFLRQNANTTQQLNLYYAYYRLCKNIQIIQICSFIVENHRMIAPHLLVPQN